MKDFRAHPLAQQRVRLALYALALAGLTTCAGGHHAVTDNKQEQSQQPTPDKPRDGEPIHLGTLEAEPMVIESVEWDEDLPFSEREVANARQILAANGYEPTPAQWRHAAASTNEVLRALAYLLLAQEPQRSDEVLFRGGLEDFSPAVRVWAAWGLIRLGDASARRVLEEIAQEPPDFGQYAPLMAIGLLGKLGDASAFPLLEQHMRTFQERNVVILYALPFAALHGQTAAPGQTVDIWAFYDMALRDSDDRVVYAALEQIEELEDPAAVPLIDAFLARESTPSLKDKAKRIRQHITSQSRD